MNEEQTTPIALNIRRMRTRHLVGFAANGGARDYIVRVMMWHELLARRAEHGSLFLASLHERKTHRNASQEGKSQ